PTRHWDESRRAQDRSWQARSRSARFRSGRQHSSVLGGRPSAGPSEVDPLPCGELDRAATTVYSPSYIAMPLALIGPRHLSTSLATKWDRYSGERRSCVTTVAPVSRSIACTSGFSSVWPSAPFKMLTTEAGAPLGRKNPNHVPASKSARPASPAVGTS